MVRDTRSLPHAEYLRLAMGHRFCLVAPGDYPSTHKVAEAMALGGSGGCIPVFVVPEQAGGRAGHPTCRACSPSVGGSTTAPSRTSCPSRGPGPTLPPS